MNKQKELMEIQKLELEMKRLDEQVVQVSSPTTFKAGEEVSSVASSPKTQLSQKKEPDLLAGSKASRLYK